METEGREHEDDRAGPQDVVIASDAGPPLRGWYWPHAAPRGVLVIVHGFGEHGGCYGHVVEALRPPLELDVLSFDQRGHGRSPGRRGVVRQYKDLADDVEAALAWVARRRPGAQLYLLAHSNGGLIALILAMGRGGAGPDARTPALAGLIVSNPALRVVAPVAPAKLLIGRALLLLAPGVTLSGQIDAAQMTRDPEFQRAHETDPLRHSRISAPLFFGMTGWGETVAASAASITLPVLMLLGGSDPVIDAETSRQFFARLGSQDKTLRVYPAMLHEPLNELDREQVLADITSWLQPRLEARAVARQGA
jgi:alpha-beta hydrolase superfamily lysophospholipase